MKSFSFSHNKDFWGEILCNMLQEIHTIFSIHLIFCINFWWITNNFQKIYKFNQIMHFVLKNYPNFKMYEIILIILCFVFLFHKLQLCFRCHVHYTPFTCAEKLLEFKNIFNKFFFKFFFKFHNFQIVSVFWMWVQIKSS